MLKEIWIEGANHVKGTRESVQSHLFEHFGYSAIQMWRVRFYIRGCFLLGPRQETGKKTPDLTAVYKSVYIRIVLRQAVLTHVFVSSSQYWVGSQSSQRYFMYLMQSSGSEYLNS